MSEFLFLCCHQHTAFKAEFLQFLACLFGFCPVGKRPDLYPGLDLCRDAVEFQGGPQLLGAGSVVKHAQLQQVATAGSTLHCAGNGA